jgi:hypothetical protein
MKDILSDVSSTTFYKRINGRLVEVDIDLMSDAALSAIQSEVEAGAAFGSVTVDGVEYAWD